MMCIYFRRGLSILLLLLIHTIATAQAAQTKEANYRDAVLDRQFGIIAEVKARPAGVEGTHYISQEWNVGTIYLKSGDTLKNYPLMYDIEKRLIEIQAKDVIKILPADKAVAFEWQNTVAKQVFINGDYYSLEGVPILGFLEVLSAGSIQLLSRTIVDIKKANYNTALDVGNKADKILKKEKLYFAKDKQLSEIKAKEDYSIFGNKEHLIKQYIKENKLKLTKKEDAKQVIEYYNSLSKS